MSFGIRLHLYDVEQRGTLSKSKAQSKQSEMKSPVTIFNYRKCRETNVSTLKDEILHPMRSNEI